MSRTENPQNTRGVPGPDEEADTASGGPADPPEHDTDRDRETDADDREEQDHV